MHMTGPTVQRSGWSVEPTQLQRSHCIWSQRWCLASLLLVSFAVLLLSHSIGLGVRGCSRGCCEVRRATHCEDDEHPNWSVRQLV
eukprot:6483491-Amphidinium_carterae.1